jgi:nitrogenase subunit NifH
MFETIISRSTVIGEAQRQGKTVFQTEPDHKVTEQYRNLACELEQRLATFETVCVDGQASKQPLNRPEGARANG